MKIRIALTLPADWLQGVRIETSRVSVKSDLISKHGYE